MGPGKRGCPPWLGGLAGWTEPVKEGGGFAAAHLQEAAALQAGGRAAQGYGARPSSSSVTVTAGRRAPVKVPGERTSLKERAGVKGVSACSFAFAEPFAGHGELTWCVPFPRCCLFVRAGGPGQGPGVSPAGLAGAAGVLDAGDRAPIIRAAGEGSRRGWVCVFGCGGPMAGLRPGRPAGCIHPFACPGRACRGAWGGYAAGRAGSITRAPALPGRRWPAPGGGGTLRGLAPGCGPGPGHAACPGRLARRMCPSRMP
jgi:hypothetical protein